MKMILCSLAIMFYSISSYACPNLEGVFFDAQENMERTITQVGCHETVWKDQSGTKVLLADNVERILEDNGNIKAYSKSYFSEDKFILELRMDWGSYSDWGFPAAWKRTYWIDRKGHLVETLVAYDKEGHSGSVEYYTYRRIE